MIAALIAGGVVLAFFGYIEWSRLQVERQRLRHDRVILERLTPHDVQPTGDYCDPDEPPEQISHRMNAADPEWQLQDALESLKRCEDRAEDNIAEITRLRASLCALLDDANERQQPRSNGSSQFHSSPSPTTAQTTARSGALRRSEKNVGNGSNYNGLPKTTMSRLSPELQAELRAQLHADSDDDSESKN